MILKKSNKILTYKKIYLYLSQYKYIFLINIKDVYNRKII